ncbi:class I and II aminotransferase [Halovivax asiaticus JCM 14624]|uniref:Aminotransferase n=1 Tax=Halovivax asiaticus JCM 14624 TaxID=1227490 RepID=M0BVQ5_9EURY|nr:aminotransferase class I/II-fold pyridoxal phosphate-dependent enzyme [Halovivax asiaticus]ELZ13754.1 class I and II aminotransferase [Halovivax asiaticus JCM 14624]
MTDRIAARVDQLDPSGIRQFFDVAAAHDDVISLGVGEPDFAPPAAARTAVIESVERGDTDYTSNRGMKGLRSELASFVGRYGLAPSPDSILVTTGASEAIDLAMRTLVDPEDTVAIPHPSYVSYGPAVTLAGGTVCPVRTKPERDFRLTVDALSDAGAESADVLLLCYPNNPTGATMPESALQPIATFAREHDLVVISDEIYAELTYDHDHVSIASFDGMADRTVVVSGFSKAFAMTGFRLGYAIGPAAIIDAMTRVHQYTMLSAPTQAQFAAKAALDSCLNDVDEMIASYERRRDLVRTRLDEIGLDCADLGGAFYAFPTVPDGWSATKFAERLLDEYGVAVVPGTAFGDTYDDHVRLSYATDEESLQTAFDRIEAFLADHRANGDRSRADRPDPSPSET